MKSRGAATLNKYREVLPAWPTSRLTEAFSKPGVRNSTHLLDLMPENTVVYAALPNLANTIAESHRIIQERMSQNAALREWWEKEQSAASAEHGPGRRDDSPVWFLSRR